MSDRLHVATRKGLFTLERVSGAWRIANVSHLGDPISMVLPDRRDGALYAGLWLGHFGVKLRRSTDGGEAWEEIATPVFPEKPPELDDRDGFGNEVPWSVQQIWALEPGGDDQPGRLWCGTIPGGLFRSDDAGDSWRLVESLWNDSRRGEWFGGGTDLPVIHSVCVDSRDSTDIVIGVSCGGAGRSRDDGQTWDVGGEGMWATYLPPGKKNDPNVQDPHRLVQCPADPSRLWVQHHNGIFRSIDRADSWTDHCHALPSSFGFAVAAHPTDPNTAWFVPAISDDSRVPVDGKWVVTRTRDGGETFEALREGLPQEHAYDIVFRHALDVDETGERLAMGSTTGSLYVSENGGDSWSCVSEHLPPVYCVRFESA
jgi:hypothetical protein